MKPAVAIHTLPLVFAIGAGARQAASQAVAQPPSTAARVGLPDRPIVLDADGQKVKVTAIKGLQTPWALAVLPNLDILVTERAGRLRIIRGGVLDYKPVVGVPGG